MMNQKGIAFIPLLFWIIGISYAGLATYKIGHEITQSIEDGTFSWLDTPTPSETSNKNLNLIISPSDPSPTPITVPQKVQIAKIEPDPITTCNNPNCGPIQIPKSQCSDTVGYVCCQIGSKWTWYASRTKCSADQANVNQQNQSNSDPLIICKSKTGDLRIRKSVCSSSTDCPDGKGGFIFISQDLCKERWSKVGQDLTKYLKEYWDAKLEQDRLKTQLGTQELQNKTNQAIQDMNNTADSVSQPTFETEPLPTIKELPSMPYYGVKCSDLRGEGNITELHCDP